MDDMEKKQRLATIFKWGGALAVCFAVAPFIFIAIKGMVGLALAGVIGYALIELQPWFAMKTANAVLSLLKREARTNPIETRQNILIEERQKLKKYADEITTFATEVANFADEVKQLRQTQPEDAADFEEQLGKLRKLLELKKQAYGQAVQRANEFEEATNRAARKWKVAQSAVRINRLAGQSKEDALNKIMAEEALDSVQTAMNRAFAELETAVAITASHEVHVARYDKSTPFGEHMAAAGQANGKEQAR